MGLEHLSKAEKSRQKDLGGFTFLANPLHCIFPLLSVFSWPCLAMVSLPQSHDFPSVCGSASVCRLFLFM